MTGNSEYTVLGTRPPRFDAVDKVTGRALYGPDIHLPKMLHGKILRSPHAHARIVSIDTSEAEKMPGVKAVITHRDVPGVWYPARLPVYSEALATYIHGH